MLIYIYILNSLCPNDTQWHRCGSTLTQVMACCLIVPSPNVDFSLVRFCGIHLRAISQGVSKLLFCIISLKSTLLNLLSHLPGAEWINTLRQRQNGRHFPDDIFRCIFLNETIWISIKISLNFVPQSPINNIPALAQIMAWRRPGDKPLSEAMMITLLMHICVTRPQWVKQQDKD